jgi:hypothetical protein
MSPLLFETFMVLYAAFDRELIDLFVGAFL